MRPIIFSTPMVKAILEGRKTQTRRIMKYTGRRKDYNCKEFPGELQDAPDKWGPCSDVRPTSFTNDIIYPGPEEDRDNNCYVDFETKISKDWFWQACIKCPYGKPGDILYVRETSAVTYSTGPKMKRTVWYKADDPIIPPNVSFKWKPSIHMLRGSARIFLKITDISVERLQDISKSDAIAEGILHYHDDVVGLRFKDYLADAKGYGHPEHDYPTVGDPVTSFGTLWASINGEESWKESPWIWKITFERTNKPS